MTTHRDRADQAMQQALNAATTDPSRASILASVAQTHATLEVAEQLRITNLIVSDYHPDDAHMDGFLHDLAASLGVHFDMDGRA